MLLPLFPPPRHLSLTMFASQNRSRLTLRGLREGAWSIIFRPSSGIINMIEEQAVIALRGPKLDSRNALGKLVLANIRMPPICERPRSYQDGMWEVTN